MNALATITPVAARAVAPLAVVVMLSSCATGGGSEGSARGVPAFPSAAEAQALASSHRTLPPATPQIVLGSHTVAQALPPSLGETPLPPRSEGASAFEKMAQATLTNGSVQATCAARELAGVIVTAPNAAVEDRQRRAIFDRCGLSNQRARVQYVSYSGVPKGGVEALVKQQPDDVREHLKTYGQRGEFSGAGAAERDDTVVLVFVSHGPSPLTGVRTLSDPGQRSVVFNGVAEADVEAVAASVTSGAYDAAPCATDESVVLPNFRVTCSVSADDAFAYVDVSTKVRGKMLSRFASRAMIIADETLARTWIREVPTDAAPSPSTKGFAQATVEGVNAVRARAGRKPLRLAAARSATGVGPSLGVVRRARGQR